MIQNFFKKKAKWTIIVVIITILIGQGIGAAIHQGEESTLSSSNLFTQSSNTAEFIDQKNGGEGCGGCGSTGNIFLEEGVIVAQSFIPTHATLSKIQLTISKLGTPPENTKLTLSIRDSLSNENLVSTEVDATEGTITFDFEDLELTPGNQYFMLCTSDNSGESNDGYTWSYTKDNYYSAGDAWIIKGSGDWHNLDNEISGTGSDMFFTTYWKDYGPNPPRIDGIQDGKKQERYDYTISAIDPEDDDVYFFIEWGDGRSMGWIGPYASGEEVTKNHQWASEGNYTLRVKAKDTYGVEGDWQTMHITLPKHNILPRPFYTFLQNHPNLFPLLQYLLGLK